MMTFQTERKEKNYYFRLKLDMWNDVYSDYYHLGFCDKSKNTEVSQNKKTSIQGKTSKDTTVNVLKLLPSDKIN